MSGEDVERYADGFLVEWERYGETWVECHADEPRAVDQARRMGGTCTPLYRAHPPEQFAERGEGETSAPLPADVVRLVIAGREIWEREGASGDDMDRALEAFASRVPYEDEQGEGEGA